MTTLIEHFTNVTFEELDQALSFHQRHVKVFGKSHPQPRLTSWYAPVEYSYSGLTWPSKELPPILKRIQEELEDHTGILFPTVLVNKYRDGMDTVGWHSDDEPLFGPDPIIASLSFGAQRDFFLRHNVTKEKTAYALSDQSLLLMPKGTQGHYQHSLPRRKKVMDPRINLTFRTLP